MKKLYSLAVAALAALTFTQNVYADDPDLSKYTAIKTMDFSKATYPSDVDMTLTSNQYGTAWETGNKLYQKIFEVATPEDLKGYLALQQVHGSKGWWIRSTKGGLYSYNAQRSGAVINLKKDYVVAFNCTQDAANVMTLTNADGDPDGPFTFAKSDDTKTYYATLTADGQVGFCGNKNGGYISSIVVYAPGTVVVKPTASYTAVNGKSRTVTFSGSNLAYNTDGSDTYTNFKDGDGANVNKAEVTVDQTTTYYVVSTNGDQKSEVLQFTIEAGQELSLAKPVVSISKMGEGFTRTYSVVCNNADVLLAPTAKLTYDFTPTAGGEAANGVECNGTIEATAAGTYVVTATAEGYTSTTVEIDNTKEYELAKTIDFTAITADQLSGNWKKKAEAGSLPGSSSQWVAKYGDVVADEYYYDFSAENASATDIIEGLNVEFNKDGKTPKLYTGFGFMYPIYQLNAAGDDNTDNKVAITYGNVGIADGTAEQVGVYTYINNYGKNGTKSTILAGDELFPLYRFSDMLTKVEIYTPKAVEPEEPAMTLPEAGTYYIKNVATGKYFAAGNSWGSQAIVNDHGMDVTLALTDGKYTLDTQISNGDTKHFLGTNLFTDNEATPFELALVKTADGKDAITISDGSKFVAAQADNSSLVSVDAADNDYAKWVFVADSARLADLANATADNGMDATWLLKGYNFGRNDLRNSNWQGSPKLGGDNTNFNAEKYNTTFDVYQTITVPNGKYTVEAQAYYRNGNIKTSAAAHLDGTEQLLAKLYANSAEVDVPSIYSGAGKADVGSTADGIEGKFPNSQGDASAFFSAGAYNVVLENVNVVDGTLKIGLKKSETTSEDWTCFDNIRLTYYGEINDVAVFKEEYEAALAAAKATVADEAYAVVTGEELATLNAVIEQNSTVAEETKEAYQAATAALNEAKSAFTDAKPAYQNLVDTKAQYKDFDFTAYPYADSGRASAVKRSMSATAKTATDATQIAQNIVNGIRGYVESNAVAEGVDGAEPATEIIQNPNAEAAEGWTLNSTVGSGNKIDILKNEPLTDSEGNTEYPYFDGVNWNANSWDVTYTQTVGLPRGKYLLSAFSRASEGVSTFDLIANVVADENGGIAPLDGEITVEPGDGDNTGDAEAADTVRFKAPMQHIGAEGGIFGRGWNNNTLEFEVTSDYANVDLGIHGATTTQHNWMSFTSFQLTLLEQSVEEVEVENIAALRKLVTDPNADYNVKLKLTDAKISKIVKESYGGQEMTSFAVIEDATGALSLGYLLPEAEAEGLISTEGWKDGTTLNGYICGTYNYPSDMFANANTAKSEITATESTFTPTAANLSDVLKAENNYRSYEFKDVKIATVGEGDFVSYALVANETTNVSMIDAFSVLPEEMPTEFATVSGILVGDIQYGSESADFNFYPVAYTLKSTGISSIDQAAKNAAVYTVNGVKVRAAGETVKGLKKGVYVVGGKKIVVK